MLNCCIVNPKVGPLSSHNCNCALHQASKVCTHPSVASFAAFFSCNKKFANCKRRLNTAKTWQRGYESVSVVTRYSFLHYQANLDEARSDDAVHPGCLLRILGGPLHGDSWTIQAPSPCNRPPSIFGSLSCKRPWVLARDNTLAELKICTLSKAPPRVWPHH